MADTQQTPGADDLKNKVDALSESVNKIVEVLERSPAMKAAGYTTDDGGATDATHKSFGDFLLAVKRGDAKRLATVYGSKRDDGDTKDMSWYGRDDWRVSGAEGAPDAPAKDG